MYKVVLYETPAGSKPIEKFMMELSKKHKDDNITQIQAMLEDFQELGFGLNNKIKNAIKPLRDQIFELRPSPSRIFFFHHIDGMFVLLHGFEKKCQKTPKSEIDKAVKEKNSFIKRYKK